MFLSNQNSPNKIGFTGSYSSLMTEIEILSKPEENFVAIFTLMLDKIPTLEGYCLTFFLDVNFANENYIIPKMSTIDTFPESVNGRHIEQQQVGYKSIIFSKNRHESEIRSVILPRFIYEAGDKADTTPFGRMDRLPAWKADDETPPTGPEGPPKFLFQISEGFMFETLASAPRQKVIDYLSDDMVSFRDEPKYQIFAGNEIYFFAYEIDGRHEPFIVVQS